MKKQKIITVILLAFFSTLPCFSQYGNVNGRQANANFEGNLAANNMMRGRDVLQDVLNKGKDNEITIADVKGDPYGGDKHFTNGNLMYKDSLNLGAFLMRFNAYSDEMEVNNANGENTVINKADYISIILRNEKYVPLNYSEDDEEIKKGFFIEKVKGKDVSLFLRKYKTIKQGQEAKSSFHKETPPMFVEREAYFLKFGNNKPVEIKLNKNKILKTFPDKANELKKFAGQKNVNIETESGLISLVEYYNSIK